MTRPLNLIVLFAALMMLVGPARADKAEQALPPQAIGNSTMLAVYIDLTQLDAEMIEQIGETIMGLADNPALEDQGLALPLGDPQQFVDMLTLLRGSLLQAGCEKLAMTLEMPGDESWSPQMTMLAKANDNFDAASVTALLRSLGEGEVEAEVEALGNGWQNLSMTSKLGEPITLDLPKPDAAAFDAFNKQLTKQDKPIFAVAFRMQDEMRKMIDMFGEAAKDAEPGEGAEVDMMAGMLMGMFKPISKLDTIGLSFSQVEDNEMLVDAQMTFQDAVSAQQFANVYNTVMLFAPVALAQAAQAGEIENMPDAATINQFFMSLQMKVADESLTLRLDQAFFDLAKKLTPLFENLEEGAGDFDL